MRPNRSMKRRALRWGVTMSRLPSDPIKRLAQQEKNRAYRLAYKERIDPAKRRERDRLYMQRWRAKNLGVITEEVPGVVRYVDPPRGFDCDRAVWPELAAAFWAQGVPA